MLYLMAPLTHTAAKVRATLKGRFQVERDVIDNVLRISLDGNSAQPVLRLVAGARSNPELRDCRAEALDDLGSGYASLNLLAQLRPDYVKFDRELIRAIDRDPYKQKVVRKLIEMALELGIGTVAEGIERREEWLWLRDAGIEYAQRYWFARPASPPPVPVANP